MEKESCFKELTNSQLELAYDLIENTGVNLFLTGKAGTGKTTFLRKLQRQSYKRMVVVAPTGVAAINAGGVTIFSLTSDRSFRTPEYNGKKSLINSTKTK